MPEKLLTLPLRRFIYYSIGLKENIEVEKEDAIKIQKADPDRAFVHVQFRDLKTDKELALPKVWHINDWNTNYEVHKIQKIRAEERRIQWDIKNNNLRTIASKCRELWGIDQIASEEMALIIYNKNEQQAYQNIGVKLQVYSEDMLNKSL